MPVIMLALAEGMRIERANAREMRPTRLSTRPGDQSEARAAGALPSFSLLPEPADQSVWPSASSNGFDLYHVQESARLPIDSKTVDETLADLSRL
jgi:hypothetical protein